MLLTSTRIFDLKIRLILLPSSPLLLLRSELQWPVPGLIPSPRPSSADEDFTAVGSQPKGETGLIHKARLVQFVHEKQYDGSSSSEADERVPGAYSTYQGKREISQRAMVGGSSGTPPEQWSEVMDVPPTPVLGVMTGGSGSGLAEKV